MADSMNANSSSGIKNTPQWLTLAIGSGAFAATNGVFAKLTTASHTHTLAAWISGLFGYEGTSTFVEFACRAIFFGLNLLSNLIMWMLFTRALTAATSTTRVAILNTSANFMVTAVLGWLVFSEALPFQWWLGAALLMAGSVVIGAREGKEQPLAGGEDEGGVMLDDTTAAVAVGAGGVVENIAAQGLYRDESDDDDAANNDADAEEHGVLAGPGMSVGNTTCD